MTNEKPERDIERRRDDALRRALFTPPKPQEALKKGKDKPGAGDDAKREKRTTGKGRSQTGKAKA